MKFAATIALGLALGTAGITNAQDATSQTVTEVHPMPVASSSMNETYSAQPVYSRSNRYSNNSSQSFFGRMMEIERRKNAWLKRTFLGIR